MVGIKLLNYGKTHNFIIHPAQRMQIETFNTDPKMKYLFCVIKYLKTVLKVDLSSYFIKKVILLETFREAMEQYEQFEWVMVKLALTETVLKPYFENLIDFDRWKPEKRDKRIPLKKYLHLQL